jgi:F0F1-type ATP synthase membrane subunit a
MSKLLSALGWIVTIPLQVIIGQIAGTLGLGIGRGEMLVSTIFMGLGIIISLLQAFIFALLTMIYIGLALEEPH